MNIEKEAKMARKNVSDMISGLGMSLRLLTSLNDKVVERGGNAAMLHFLTTSAGEENLDRIADLVVSLKWRVPKSVVIKLAREESDAQHANTDEQCFWEPALQKLKIPYIRFATEDSSNELDISNGEHHLDELKDQLEEETLESGVILTFKDEQYIMTSIGYHTGNPMPGDCIIMENVDFIHLTPIEYIDPES